MTRLPEVKLIPAKPKQQAASIPVEKQENQYAGKIRDQRNSRSGGNRGGRKKKVDPLYHQVPARRHALCHFQ